MALYGEKKYSRFCKISLILEVTLDLTDVVPQFDSFHPFNPFNPFRFSPNIHLKILHTNLSTFP